ncbi:hypothetical protein ABZX75_31185 [Streptomyces sp. NPDC003038]|uniref:hypothetical protein n=1 Tax=unclassified Streptomyces TaxID=2593676 RepID=UPI0033A295E3
MLLDSTPPTRDPRRAVVTPRGTTARTPAEASPLILPMPGGELAPCHHDRCADRLDGELSALRTSLTEGPPAAYLPPSDETGLVRHRWRTGHHAALVVRQLQARALNALAATPEAEARRLIVWTVALYDVHSVLFLYSGSCSPEQYAAVLRPGMMTAHPAFSAEWARDHAPVPIALRAAQDRHRACALDPLTRAVTHNQRVHTAVGRRLVADGAAPLQWAGRRSGDGPTEAEHALADAHFGVARRPVCASVHRAQLVRLLTLCLADIGAHGLGPLPDGCPGRFGREAVSRLVAVAVAEEPPACAAPLPQAPALPALPPLPQPHPTKPQPTKGRTT